MKRSKPYLIVSGAIFGIVGVLHALRLVYEWPAQIGEWAVPYWASVPALAVAALLAVWAFVLARGAGEDE